MPIGLARLNQKLRALIPSPCIVCARNCNENISICNTCSAELPWIVKACYRCGLPLPDSGLHANHCAKCLIEPPAINFCRGIFHYKTPIDSLITRFKFHDQLDIGFSLATLLAREFEKEYLQVPKPDLLIPVPLHRARLCQRGFNQALEIARVVARHNSIPLGRGLVLKLKNTPSQTELDSAAKRRRSQKNAFKCAKGGWPENVKHIAIIDDVVTTMGTVLSLAATLQSHEIRQLDVWCLARAAV